MSQTKYIRAKLPPVEANAILLVKVFKDSEPEMYMPDRYGRWSEINGYYTLVAEKWHKINGKSVYWSLLRYE